MVRQNIPVSAHAELRGHNGETKMDQTICKAGSSYCAKKGEARRRGTKAKTKDEAQMLKHKSGGGRAAQTATEATVHG